MKERSQAPAPSEPDDDDRERAVSGPPSCALAYLQGLVSLTSSEVSSPPIAKSL